MKKVSLFLVLGIMSLTYFSCSDENEAASENTTVARFASRGGTGLDESEMRDAKKLYSAMVSSAQYKDFAKSIAGINEKLLGNVTGAITKTDWMNWIGTNLSSTSFLSISEFEAMYDDSIGKLDAVSVRNPEIFVYFDKATPGQIREITLPPVTYPPSSSSACYDDCADIHSAAIDAAIVDYEATVQAAQHFGRLSEYLLTWTAQETYDEIEVRLALEFNACVGACPPAQ